jgi:hypothetical protein
VCSIHTAGTIFSITYETNIRRTKLWDSIQASSSCLRRRSYWLTDGEPAHLYAAARMVPQFEERFGAALAVRAKLSPLDCGY